MPAISAEDSASQENFQKLKIVCVPLMGVTRLTATTAQKTIGLLSELIQVLNTIPDERMNSSLISYVFLPLSSILQRNTSAELPDQVLERILKVLGLLSESWWWNCDLRVWEQIFMLCGAVIGGIENKGGKGKSRDDETKEAAAFCLYSLVHPRAPNDATKRAHPSQQAVKRTRELQELTQSQKSVPIVGQTLDSLLTCATSQHLPLQRLSLKTIEQLVGVYLPDYMIPSILPGVVSSMTRICLGQTHGKGWVNGEIVAAALSVIQMTVIRAVNDDVCVKSGAIRRVQKLDDFLDLSTPQAESTTDKIRFGTTRTQSWLRGTATQLHIAINTLTPLVSHPTASALNSLSMFSAKVIEATPLSLPQTQPLLLSFLLSLTLSDYPLVVLKTRTLLQNLLNSSSSALGSLEENLMTNLGNNLSALPRLVSTQADQKIMHTAGLIEAVCRLCIDDPSQSRLSVVSKGVGKLLGPTGGIEKWGWSLLSVLEIEEPSVVVTHTSSAQLALEADPQAQGSIPFPEVGFKNISSHETRDAITRMLYSLGKAAGESALFSVEWFYRSGAWSSSLSSVASLWCACRLLEGIVDGSLSLESFETSSHGPRDRRVEKHIKILVGSIAEIWDQSDSNPKAFTADNNEREENPPTFVQHQKGLVPLLDTLKIVRSSSTRPTKTHQPVVHRALCIQLLSISAGAMKERFRPLFIRALYPILHSLVSPLSFLSATGLASLNFVSHATSYASPANLLLSNFDYVLDSVSRRLTPRWLDIDATKVLGIMVRLVGADMVEKAGDVVEECFDRLDEFHGYGVVVDGLVEVLNEVVKVIGLEVEVNPLKKVNVTPEVNPRRRRANLDEFFAFLPQRFQDPLTDTDMTDYGPAPREAWGKSKGEDKDEENPEPEEPIQVETTDEPLPTVIQALTKQIISRSLYFLTHDSPVIRAKILNLLTYSVPVLPESALLPSVHSAWPFVLNRLDDSEPFVVAAAAGFVAALAENVGSFMFRRIWDDVWPKFRSLIRGLEKGESTSALARSGDGRVGAQSAYTHAHRLYRSLLVTMTAALKGVEPHEPSFWEVLVAFRRFLGSHMHEEMQEWGVRLYLQAAKHNPDAVWLALTSTVSKLDGNMDFMEQAKWDIGMNVRIVLGSLD
ncbi:armadillo-type protein [Crepidotus variabilis]|uniref:Armadillo-type protein n=1 Tax=Crepidotus variabilis TaxID=179855 RepID=A0A9P6JX73_9AGAR|nr:armadillo-type protein [Crepidotus variabilis]